MKIKKCFIGAALIGLLAGVTRILQYILTIDPRGFYIGGALSDFLSGVLVGLLGVGVLWSLIGSGVQRKDQAVFSKTFNTSNPTRVLFLLLAVISLADGAWRWYTAGFSLPVLLCLAGALAWASLGIFGNFLPLMQLFPLLQLGALIVDYFKHTYKYIQVSAYSLSLLGLCAVTYFALTLIKVLSGAECSRRRFVRASTVLLVLGCSAFLTPLYTDHSLSGLLFAAHGFTYCLLAALTLIWMPEGRMENSTSNSIPDPQKLDQYINEIPEVDENEL